jgi:TonB family protein
VRCVTCQTEGITLQQHCECCGRPLSASGASDPETDHAAKRVYGMAGRTTRAASSESAPAADGDDDWEACRQAFDEWVGTADLSPPDGESTMSAPVVHIKGSEEAAAMTSSPSCDSPALTVSEEQPSSVAALIEVTEASQTAATEPALPEEVETEVAHTVDDTTAVVVNESPVPLPVRYRTYGAVAAVLVGTIALGSYWVLFHGQPMSRREEQPTIAKSAAKVVAARSTMNIATRKKDNTRKMTVAVPRDTTPVARKSAVVPVRGQAKAVAPPKAETPVAPLSASSLTSRAPEPLIAPPVPDVVAMPVYVPPAPARSPFFETTDVNEAPQVATRIGPHIPDDLRATAQNDIVVVRLLVSQNGHPSHVGLLRRSKGGLRLDDAVIAAVNQWTFVPAKKGGEAVSCWFNLGMPLDLAD